MAPLADFLDRVCWILISALALFLIVELGFRVLPSARVAFWERHIYSEGWGKSQPPQWFRSGLCPNRYGEEGPEPDLSAGLFKVVVLGHPLFFYPRGAPWGDSLSGYIRDFLESRGGRRFVVSDFSLSPWQYFNRAIEAPGKYHVSWPEAWWSPDVVVDLVGPADFKVPWSWPRFDYRPLLETSPIIAEDPLLSRSRFLIWWVLRPFRPRPAGVPPYVWFYSPRLGRAMWDSAWGEYRRKMDLFLKPRGGYFRRRLLIVYVPSYEEFEHFLPGAKGPWDRFRLDYDLIFYRLRDWGAKNGVPVYSAREALLQRAKTSRRPVYEPYQWGQWSLNKLGREAVAEFVAGRLKLR